MVSEPRRGRKKTHSHLQHTLVATAALGHPLPKGAQIHHIDDDGWNNARTNLVLCQDNAYHKLIHLRRKAYRATGDPEQRTCTHCKKWDRPENLSLCGIAKRQPYHKACAAAYQRSRRPVS